MPDPTIVAGNLVPGRDQMNIDVFQSVAMRDNALAEEKGPRAGGADLGVNVQETVVSKERIG